VCCSTRHDTQTVDKKSEKQITEDKESILYKKEILHNFSSTVDKDTFKIYVTGQSIKDGQIKFQIIKKDGIIILDETFPTYQFLDYGLKDNSTDKEKEEYIKGKLDKLFNEDNFHQPAIAANDTFDEDYTKKEIWDEIISDQTTIGFYYKIGEEDMRFIAYSKRQMKIVIYYNCC
jgi:hypothetical protein